MLIVMYQITHCNHLIYSKGKVFKVDQNDYTLAGSGSYSLTGTTDGGRTWRTKKCMVIYYAGNLNLKIYLMHYHQRR